MNHSVIPNTAFPWFYRRIKKRRGKEKQGGQLYQVKPLNMFGSGINYCISRARYYFLKAFLFDIIGTRGSSN